MPSCSPSSSAAGVACFPPHLPRFPKCQLIGHCHPLREPLPIWTLSLARVVRHFDRGRKAVSVHKMGKREAGGGVVRLWWMLEVDTDVRARRDSDARGTVTCLFVPVY